MLARLIKGTKQYNVCILLLFLFHVGRVRRKLMRREKCYMRTLAVVWPIINVHFLNVIRRKAVCECVCVCW